MNKATAETVAKIVGGKTVKVKGGFGIIVDNPESAILNSLKTMQHGMNIDEIEAMELPTEIKMVPFCGITTIC